MSGGVFVSYRREDTQGSAGRLYDRLTHELGREAVFFDVDNISPGVDFVEVLSNRVGSCAALLAVIGGHWTTIKDEVGLRRLDNPNDFVRIEVEAALERRVPVIPVLVDGARMPRVDDLPDSLKSLARRQAAEVSHARFDFDADRLFRVVRRIIDQRIREELERQQTAEAERIVAEERQREAEAEAARVAAERRRRDAERRAARTEERKRRKVEAEAALAAEEERLRFEQAEAEYSAELVRLQTDAEAVRVAEDERRRKEEVEAARLEVARQQAHADAIRVLYEQRWLLIEDENVRAAELVRRKAEFESFIASVVRTSEDETDPSQLSSNLESNDIESQIFHLLEADRLHRNAEGGPDDAEVSESAATEDSPTCDQWKANDDALDLTARRVPPELQESADNCEEQYSTTARLSQPDDQRIDQEQTQSKQNESLSIEPTYQIGRIPVLSGIYENPSRREAEGPASDWPQVEDNFRAAAAERRRSMRISVSTLQAYSHRTWMQKVLYNIKRFPEFIILIIVILGMLSIRPIIWIYYVIYYIYHTSN